MKPEVKNSPESPKISAIPTWLYLVVFAVLLLVIVLISMVLSATKHQALKEKAIADSVLVVEQAKVQQITTELTSAKDQASNLSIEVTSLTEKADGLSVLSDSLSTVVSRKDSLIAALNLKVSAIPKSFKAKSKSR